MTGSGVQHGPLRPDYGPGRDIFDDPRYRWARLCKIAGHWHVITGYEPEPGWPAGRPVLRPLRHWSPRDLVRIPLHRWWERTYW